MPPIGPISQRNLIRYMRRLGWSGPDAGGRHLVMIKGTKRQPIPNPHSGDISREFLLRILAEAGIDRESWEAL